MKRSEAMMRDLEDYFRIRFENKIAIRPRREDCHLTAATRVLARKQELNEVESDLQQRKDWYNDRTNQIAQERAVVEQREKALKMSLLRFDKFLKENDSKRHRAVKKVEDERILHGVKDREIAKLTEHLRHYNAEKDEMEKKVNKNKYFLEFLEKVAEKIEDFNEVDDVLERYDVLSATKQYLVRREQLDQDHVEAAKLEQIRYSEGCDTVILGLNNQLSELQSRYDKAQEDVVNWENTWTRIKNTAAKKTLLLGQVKMAIHNLYQLCNRYYQAHALTPEEKNEMEFCHDPNLQLTRVREVLQDLHYISKECKRNEQEAQAETNAQPAY